MGIFFSKSDEKRSVTRVQLTYSPRPRAALTAASRSLVSLGFPVNSGSRDAPSICVFSTLALSCSALDRWRLGGELYSTPLKTAKALPSCSSSGWGCRVLYSTPGYRLPRLMLCWRTRCASSTGGSLHTGASSQRSRSVPRRVVLDVLALVFWRCKPSR